MQHLEFLSPRQQLLLMQCIGSLRFSSRAAATTAAAASTAAATAATAAKVQWSEVAQQAMPGVLRLLRSGRCSISDAAAACSFSTS